MTPEIDVYANQAFIVPADKDILNAKEILSELGSSDEDQNEARMTYLKQFFIEYME